MKNDAMNAAIRQAAGRLPAEPEPAAEEAPPADIDAHVRVEPAEQPVT